MTDRPRLSRSEGGHVPVLGNVVVDIFRHLGPGLVVDTTVGLGGHASLLLDSHPGLRVLGLDQDVEALAVARDRLRRFGSRVELHHARSDGLVALLDRLGIDDVSGILADLGVSSPQIDQPERGFSYRPDRDGPLDMRMNRSEGRTALQVLAEIGEGAFVRALQDLADEPHARRIARAVLEAEPRTTAALAEVVRAAVPAARRRSGDPAKRVFQTLRILVNDEIATLDRTLDAAFEVLRPGGRVAVIAFHSAEDRLVKRRFRAAADGACTCPPGLPCVCGARVTARLLRRKPWVADAQEVADNPRSASARLRAVEVQAPVAPASAGDGP